MINVNGLKRNAKNIVKKYSDAQMKVREATSNDPWGPSATIMAEIADLTYNVVAFSEIMQMIWKRLNDHGKNWRHVYKSLVLLEYLIKTGTEKVAQQCMDNIFSIKTLKDFQYMEDGKDHGMNVREKSKKLVALLNDSEKLKTERDRAMKAKSRLLESMSSEGKISTGSSSSISGRDDGSTSSGLAHLPDVGSLNIHSSELDTVRPQSISEEEYQLKLALALSKKEAEQQEKTRKNDELRLKLALDVSKSTAGGNLLDDLLDPPPASSSSTNRPKDPKPSVPTSGPSKSTIDDLLGLSISPPEPQNDPWSSDPWQTTTTTTPSLATTAFNMTTTTETLSGLAPINPSTSSILTSDNVANKRSMSKNPFED